MHEIEKENRIYPFLWLKSEEESVVIENINAIYKSGARGFCIEARGYTAGFGSETWFALLEKIFSRAKELGMKVWLLDDKHCPSGRANDVLALEENKMLRKRHLYESHFDFLSNGKTVSVFVPELMNEEDVFIGAYLYRLQSNRMIWTGERIKVEKTDNGFVTFKDKKGTYRAVFLFATYRFANAMGVGGNDYIDLINANSVEKQIQEIYEPHYRRLSKYFGNTFCGFFADEPFLGNGYFYGANESSNAYTGHMLGEVGLLLPWSDELHTRMQENGWDTEAYLPSLWFDMGEITAPFRTAYMNVVTELISQNYVEKIGEWCRSHGVVYTGHICEGDKLNNAMGVGMGSYYRAMRGQDIAGIDIIFQQILPGYGHFSRLKKQSAYNATFFHYQLAQMCSSDAHLDPIKKNRAMCELFGASGWAYTVSDYKWLADFLLVRGINYFVPHAFSGVFPDPDCPPHFYAQGMDTQFEGFCELIPYMQTTADMLSAGVHCADVLLYEGDEAVWSGDKFLPVCEVAKKLLDGHITYDLLSRDALRNVTFDGKGFRCNGETYSALIVPQGYATSETRYAFQDFETQGGCVIYVDESRSKSKKSVSLTELVRTLRKKEIGEIEAKSSLLRHYHTVTEEDGKQSHTIMFFNESIKEDVIETIKVPFSGQAVLVDNEAKTIETIEIKNGKFSLRLECGQAKLLVFPTNVKGTTIEKSVAYLKPKWSMQTANYDTPEFYVDCGEYSPERYQELLKSGFSGKIKLSAKVEVNGLDFTHVKVLGAVGGVQLWINGEHKGIRISNPYLFVANAEKKNALEVTLVVSTTMYGAIRDGFSYGVPLYGLEDIEIELLTIR